MPIVKEKFNLYPPATAKTVIFERLSALEVEVQRLKVEAFFGLPQKKQSFYLYPQEDINKALKATRNDIWQKRYARAVKGIS